MRTTKGHVTYGGNTYPLTLEVSSHLVPGSSLSTLMRALQVDVNRKLGRHGDASRIRRFKLVVEGDAFTATFEEEVA